ncbi:unnamed protein product [Ambrosiozyma monospora]|uniref:Unnamed protein product n=1 Tax=Ambrosiozyma monospora TaxID=43982 RepID=A0ACB5TY03_AMBMO|nr:unnamed protein product [Ambrosiozyma monospora]
MDWELEDIQEKSTRRVKQQYSRASKLLEKINAIPDYLKESKAAVASVWIDLVSELIEVFSTYRCLFMASKASQFRNNLRKRTTNLSVDQKLSRMTSLPNEIILSNQMGSGKIPTPKKDFKGISFDDWYELFMKYALMIAEYEQNSDDAIDVQEIAKYITAFEHKKTMTNLVGLSIGLITKDGSLILSQLRILMNEYQFCASVYKTFLASCLPDSFMYIHYADAPGQKHLLRQVKAFDGLAENRTITGMATIANTNVDVSRDHPYLNHG